MQAVTWSSRMALGVPQMDQAHQSLLARLGKLAAEPDETFHEQFVALAQAIEADFKSEEALMEQIDFPGLPAHREQHARVLSALHHADPQVAQGDIQLGRICIELLPQWFLVHQATMDHALAVALDFAGHLRQAAPANDKASRRAASPRASF
jgi:hemerythrin